MTIPLTLEDRVYCLNRTPQLNQDPSFSLAMVVMNSLFLRGDDKDALDVVEHIEQTCLERGIEIFIPEHAVVKEVELIAN